MRTLLFIGLRSRPMQNNFESIRFDSLNMALRSWPQMPGGQTKRANYVMEETQSLRQGQRRPISDAGAELVQAVLHSVGPALAQSQIERGSGRRGRGCGFGREPGPPDFIADARHCGIFVDESPCDFGQANVKQRTGKVQSDSKHARHAGLGCMREDARPIKALGFCQQSADVADAVEALPAILGAVEA